MKDGWRAESLCKDLDPIPQTWFFGDDPNVSTKDQHERAAMFCQVCPAREDCLHEARIYDDSFGVWGGLTPSQRKRYFRGPSESLDRVVARAETRLDMYLAERGVTRDDDVTVITAALSEPIRSVRREEPEEAVEYQPDESYDIIPVML